MKAAIVVLADPAIQNILRRMVFELNCRTHTRFFAALLPAHVSLKQPFVFEDMAVLERYFDELARRTAPFEIALDRVYYEEWSGHAIVGLSVVETPVLRELHNQLNAELSDLFRDTRANHDGSGYHFHMTVELSPVGAENGFKAYFDSLAEKQVNLHYTAAELALFYYAVDVIEPGSFIHYRTQPLTGRS
jgi:2'-5' RNA ligase